MAIDRFDVTIGDGNVFNFVNLDSKSTPPYRCARLGSWYGVLEFDFSYLDCTIVNSVCVLCHTLYEKSVELPPIQALTKQYVTPFFMRGEYNSGYAGDFEIAFTRDEAVVILHELTLDDADITAYVASNRLTFYYGDDFVLRCIKISDLTEEEYEFLKKEEQCPGAYMGAEP